MSEHDRTIPRALVHKAGPEAVWLDELSRLGDDTYRAVGQVPRAHSYVNDSLEPLYTYYDIGLLTELGRQAGIATMHEFEGVHIKAPTVFLKYDLTIEDPVPGGRTPAPVPVVLDITYLNREYEGDRLSVLLADTVIEIDGVRRATCRSLAAAYERDQYKAWRREMKDSRPPQEIPAVKTIDPGRVGRRSDENVLIGALEATDDDGFTCDVHVDQLHPHFFEHPMDHIPGVVHIEAMRQAALVAAAERFGLSPVGAVVMDCSARFTSFAELHLPTTCTLTVREPRPTDDGHIDVPVSLRLSQPGDDDVTSAKLVVRGRTET